MSKGKRVTAHERIIKRVDAFATSLLDKVQTDAAGKALDLDKQLQVFKEVANWVKIKHGIIAKTDDEAATEGALISELKNSIAGHPGKRANGAGSAKPRPVAAAKPATGGPAGRAASEPTRPLGRAERSGEDGAQRVPGAHGPAPGLAALKASLPGANAGNAVGHLNDAGGAVRADDERHRRLHAGILSDTAGDADDADGGGDV